MGLDGCQFDSNSTGISFVFRKCVDSGGTDKPSAEQIEIAGYMEYLLEHGYGITFGGQIFAPVEPSQTLEYKGDDLTLEPEVLAVLKGIYDKVKEKVDKGEELPEKGKYIGLGKPENCPIREAYGVPFKGSSALSPPGLGQNGELVRQIVASIIDSEHEDEFITFIAKNFGNTDGAFEAEDFMDFVKQIGAGDGLSYREWSDFLTNTKDDALKGANLAIKKEIYQGLFGHFGDNAEKSSIDSLAELKKIYISLKREAAITGKTLRDFFAEGKQVIWITEETVNQFRDKVVSEMKNDKNEDLKNLFQAGFPLDLSGKTDDAEQLAEMFANWGFFKDEKHLQWLLNAAKLPSSLGGSDNSDTLTEKEFTVFLRAALSEGYRQEALSKEQIQDNDLTAMLKFLKQEELEKPLKRVKPKTTELTKKEKRLAGKVMYLPSYSGDLDNMEGELNKIIKDFKLESRIEEGKASDYEIYYYELAKFHKAQAYGQKAREKEQGESMDAEKFAREALDLYAEVLTESVGYAANSRKKSDFETEVFDKGVQGLYLMASILKDDSACIAKARDMIIACPAATKCKGEWLGKLARIGHLKIADIVVALGDTSDKEAILAHITVSFLKPAPEIGKNTSLEYAQNELIGEELEDVITVLESLPDGSIKDELIAKDLYKIYEYLRRDPDTKDDKVHSMFRALKKEDLSLIDKYLEVIKVKVDPEVEVEKLKWEEGKANFVGLVPWKDLLPKAGGAAGGGGGGGDIYDPFKLP